MTRVTLVKVVSLMMIGAMALVFARPASAHPITVPRAAAACFFIGTCTTASGVTTCTCSGTLKATAEALHVVEAQSGEETLHCLGDLNGNAPDQTTICEGSSLSTPCIVDPAGSVGAISGKHLVATQQWHEVITKSGQVTLDCKFQP